MVKILREMDRTPIAEVAKKHGVSEATLFLPPYGPSTSRRSYRKKRL